MWHPPHRSRTLWYGILSTWFNTSPVKKHPTHTVEQKNRMYFGVKWGKLCLMAVVNLFNGSEHLFELVCSGHWFWNGVGNAFAHYINAVLTTSILSEVWPFRQYMQSNIIYFRYRHSISLFFNQFYSFTQTQVLAQNEMVPDRQKPPKWFWTICFISQRR